MIAEAIADYLTANGITDSIYIDFLPDTNNAVGIFNSGGFQSSTKLPDDMPTLQIRTRNIDSATAFTTLLTIYSLLHGYHGTVNTIVINNIYGLQSNPQSLGKDDKGRQEYVINFALEIKRTTQFRQNY